MSVSPDASARFSPGQRVRLRGSGRRGIIQSAHWSAGEWEYAVFFGGDFDETYAERNLAEDVTDNTVLGQLLAWNVLDADTFRQALTTLKLRRPLEQNLYSYLASRTDLQPYQFKPVLKLLESPYGRLFIADEVGLGKTIEAGIVMLELSARVVMRRVLVVCPPALRQKWRAEMRERFEVEFDILNRARALEIFGDPDVIQQPVRAIGSLSLLRATDIVEALSESEARFDLVVIDESHHMQNPTTASHRLGEQLSTCADHMLMLSATPLSLSTDNLFHQLSILAPDEFFDASEFDDRIAPNRHLNLAIRALRSRPPKADAALRELEAIRGLRQAHLFVGNPLYEQVVDELTARDGPLDDERRFQLQRRINDLNTIGHVFTRTRKREVQDRFPARRAHVVKVQLTSAEKRFYDAVTEFVRQQSGDFASFATIMPQRQVASSIPAAREYLEERFGTVVQVEEDTAAELELDADLDDELEALDAPPSLADAWRAAAGPVDSKLDAFLGAVAGAIENGTARDGKILVFSFFRKTLEHLARRLRTFEVAGDQLRASILYGPTSQEDRHAIVDAFRNEPGPHVVLASEIAAEGLDFEFVTVMINYDLPWNPMRVEQRIGRLDRYGQQADAIHIINFSVEDTIEERVLERLYERIGIFKAAIGDLESILGNEIEQLTRELLQPGLTPEEEEDIIAQRAENILIRREENERFDRDAQALMGQDDIFSEQLSRLERDRRYVGPDEIRNFVSVALSRRASKVRLSESGGVVDIQLTPDSDVRELMSTYLLRHPEKEGARGWRAVERAKAGTTWRVTFEPEVAKARRDLDFITLQHPLVGALLAEEPEVLRPVSNLVVTSSEVEPGDYAFFVFLLNIHSFRSGLEFLPVAVTSGAQVSESVGSGLLSLLRTATSEPMSEPPHIDSLREQTAVAEEWASQRIREREDELRRISDQILDRRRASLDESFDRWLVNRRQRLWVAERQGQESIARLHAGFIRRREGELAQKLREIEERRGVQIGRELVAGGLLTVKE
jgi:superfamily II DNA or RNA helicase